MNDKVYDISVRIYPARENISDSLATNIKETDSLFKPTSESIDLPPKNQKKVKLKNRKQTDHPAASTKYIN